MRNHQTLVALALVAGLSIPAVALAGNAASASGLYIEARSAQVFIGGCIMSSEAHTVGREAVLAWRIDEGAVGDVELDGLAAVAAIAGRDNLALAPEAPRRTVLYVDARATEAQREALAELLRSRNAVLFGELAAVVPATIDVSRTDDGYAVRAGDDVRVAVEAMNVRHEDIVGCGESQWYEPFVELGDAVTAETREHAYAGDHLDARWSNPDRQSAFFGTFVY